jgi:hypothetical protein
MNILDYKIIKYRLFSSCRRRTRTLDSSSEQYGWIEKQQENSKGEGKEGNEIVRITYIYLSFNVFYLWTIMYNIYVYFFLKKINFL